MNKFNFKRRNLLSGPHLLGTLLILVGLLGLISSFFMNSGSSITKTYTVSSSAIIIGLAITFCYEGTLIDFTQQNFKDYLSICGFQIGKWRKIPEIQMVTLNTRNYIRKMSQMALALPFQRR